MQKRRASPDSFTQWIDVDNPDETQLREIATEFVLPVETVHDCLDSAHLPKFERLDGWDFLILRHFDIGSRDLPEMDTVQELTQKIAVFVSKDRLVSIHRKMPPFLESIGEKFAKGELAAANPGAVLLEIVRETIASYEPPLNEADEAIDSFELQIFNGLAENNVLEAMHFLKRKISIFRRMLRQNVDATLRLTTETHASRWQRLRERGERLVADADQQIEEMRSLLGIQISLASHRTNETMRVLTVFSAFFLPLTFLVGVYGMNFEFLPELKWHYGYPAVWGVMIFTTAGIGIWFRRRGWLR